MEGFLLLVIVSKCSPALIEMINVSFVFYLVTSGNKQGSASSSASQEDVEHINLDGKVNDFL